MESILAAQYLRMSTERQEYSLDFQSAGIAAYANLHGFKVDQTYSDEAKSGIDLARRQGLCKLLQDVVSGQHKYQAILVYDVSRWGRFQDPDEGAHYEFLCKAAGVQVHYCAELFTHTGDMTSMVLKTLKRVMAAEYSRELSQKVFAGLVRLVRKGYRTGSPPGYGFRRMLVSADKNRKQELPSGERKSIATDRVILVPGPPEEIFWVREIYRLFTEEGRTFVQIAAELDARKAPFLPGREWNDYAVRKILTHPKYKGTSVFNRTTERLGSKSRKLPQSDWILIPNAFEPIVDSEVFDAAQEALRNKYWNRSNSEVLGQLKSILKIHGYLSQSVLRLHGLSGGGVANRFGSMLKAFELAGFVSPNTKTSEHRLQVRAIRTELMQNLVTMFPGEVLIYRGSRSRKTFLKLENGPSVGLRICRSKDLPKKGRVWVLQAAKDEPHHITLVVGMNPNNTGVEALFVGGCLTNPSKMHVTERGDWFKDSVRMDDLRSFCATVRARPSG